MKDARVHAVTADADTTYADVSPEPGLLFRLGGVITCETAGTVLPLQASSGIGSEERADILWTDPGGYRFEGMAPGLLEVVAVAQGRRASGFLNFRILAGTWRGRTSAC